MNLFLFLIFGLVVGVVARTIMPGDQRMSLPFTIGLGIAGSFVGGVPLDSPDEPTLLCVRDRGGDWEYPRGDLGTGALRQVLSEPRARLRLPANGGGDAGRATSARSADRLARARSASPRGRRSGGHTA
jgi:hypothetical protein